MKKLEHYLEKITDLYPEYKGSEKDLKMYFTHFFKVVEKEVEDGYTLNAGNYKFYTYRNAREQDKWESSHRKLIYRKLKRFAKKHGRE